MEMYPTSLSDILSYSTKLSENYRSLVHCAKWDVDLIFDNLDK